MIFVARWLIVALALLLAAYLVPGITVASFYTALIVAVLLGILNLTVKPILLLLTLPITIVTFGLFALVINGVLLWFLGTFVKGFDVSGFVAALLGAFIITVVSWAGNKLFD